MHFPLERYDKPYFKLPQRLTPAVHFASFGTKLGFVTPKLWSNLKAFNDIAVGGNGFYNAAPGPDPCTGIGTPIGTSIATLFVGS